MSRPGPNTLLVLDWGSEIDLTFCFGRIIELLTMISQQMCIWCASRGMNSIATFSYYDVCLIFGLYYWYFWRDVGITASLWLFFFFKFLHLMVLGQRRELGSFREVVFLLAYGFCSWSLMLESSKLFLSSYSFVGQGTWSSRYIPCPCWKGIRVQFMYGFFISLFSYFF